MEAETKDGILEITKKFELFRNFTPMLRYKFLTVCEVEEFVLPPDVKRKYIIHKGGSWPPKENGEAGDKYFYIVLDGTARASLTGG